jgi:hypothetical protein
MNVSQIKTPPAIAITDGAFELIFPVDFSFPELPARSFNARLPVSFPNILIPRERVDRRAFAKVA